MIAKKLALIRNVIDKCLHIFHWKCIARVEDSAEPTAFGCTRRATIKSRANHNSRSPNRKYLFCKRIRALNSGLPCASRKPSAINDMEMESSAVGRNRNADFSNLPREQSVRTTYLNASPGKHPAADDNSKRNQLHGAVTRE